MNNHLNKVETNDSIKYKKDCKDFLCLNDGTIYRECKYCNHSSNCRQIDFIDGDAIPMESHYCPVVNPNTQQVEEWEYYCTGKYDFRSVNERQEDDKIS